MYCPRCGALSPTYSASSAPNQPTAFAAGAQQPTPQSSYTAYGSDPYAAPAAQQQYGTDPYSNQGPTYLPMMPITPPPPKRRGNALLIVGLVVLAVVIVGGSFFLFTSNLTNQQDNQQRANGTPQATITPQATATADPNQNPYPPKTGTLVMNDPMQDNSKGYKWDEATLTDSKNGGLDVCGFQSAAYHLTRDKKGSLICDPEGTDLVFNNLVFEAKITIKKGDEAGLVIRFDQTKGTGYLFDIATNGGYIIDSTNFSSSDPNKIYTVVGNSSGANAQIKQGLNQTNTLAIVANGGSISAYVNGVFIASAQDPAFTTGQIGLFGYGSNDLDVAVTDVRVWKL